MRVSYKEAISPNDVNVLDAALRGYGVKSGCSIVSISGYSIIVSEGTIVFGGEECSLSSKTIYLEPNSTYPYKAIIYADSASVYASIGIAESPLPSGKTKREAYKPAAPLFPSTVVPLFEVWVDPSASSISMEDIFDYRITITPATKPKELVFYSSPIEVWKKGTLTVASVLGFYLNTFSERIAASGTGTLDYIFFPPVKASFNFITIYIGEQTSGASFTGETFEIYLRDGTVPLVSYSIPVTDLFTSYNAWFQINIPKESLTSFNTASCQNLEWIWRHPVYTNAYNVHFGGILWRVSI